MSGLEQFLAAPSNSRSREYVLTTRLVHDLTVAAAARGYDLLVYLPTVDSDGFDVIFDDRDRLVPIQLKSVIKGGKASGWDVHRTLIRPEPEEVDLYGFEPSPSGAGRGGGVIVTTVKAVGSTVNVSYAYTDIDILSVLWSGILSRPGPQIERLRRLKREIESDVSGDVELPRSAFLTAASPEHLLALVGLHSRVQTQWRFRLRALLRNEHLGVELTAPASLLRATVAKELTALCGPAV